jgi:hypothetical protein
VQLTDAQLATLKAWLDANAAGLNDEEAAALLNELIDPSWWGWRSSVNRALVYHQTSPDGSTFDWTTFKNQGPAEQTAWTEMFLSDQAPAGNLNFRSGVKAIFSGSAQATAQRNHIFAAGRRPLTVGEQLFAVAVTAPPADTGNDAAQPRGSAANPDNLGTGTDGRPLEGEMTAAHVSMARQP